MPPKKKLGKEKEDDTDKLSRIAIVSEDRCKPKKCRQECKKSCPVVKIGESEPRRFSCLCFSVLHLPSLA